MKWPKALAYLNSVTNRVILSAIFATLTFTITSSASPSSSADSSTTSNETALSDIAPRYPEIFKISREILVNDLMTKKQTIRKKFKDLPETALIEYLQSHPQLLTAQEKPQEKPQDQREQIHQNLLKALSEAAKQPNDPSKHTRLIPPKGRFGYEDLKLYVSHPYFYREDDKKKQKTIAADNLVTVWNDFLASATQSIVLNIYDFDLENIAQTLINQGKKGLSVRIGIDAKVIQNRPEVKKIYDNLKSSGVVQVTPVNSIGLNHQKMAAIDFDSPEKARVLFSSGNLTQSCLDPEGDLKGENPLPEDSIPNANHVLTLKSWLLAQLINHELTKTLDPGFQLRGAQYPITGAYQVTGPGIIDPANLLSEPRPVHSVILTFTPGGGLKAVNTNLIARLIAETKGPIRMIQFAFSSDVVGEALAAKAQESYLNKKPFDFLGVGDTPFAMQAWSEFLRLSGWKLIKDPETSKKFYQEDNETIGAKTLSAEQWADLRSKIFVGPRRYRTHTIKGPDGRSREVSAKIHHKILAIGDFAILGSSFNFSANAEHNNEQILIFHEPDLARRVDGMTRWLTQQSGRTVNDEALRRNKFKETVREEPQNDAPL